MPENSRPIFLGVDIGTYESKGVAIDCQGVILASATRAHTVGTPKPGWVEHDADEVWWQGFVAICRELLSAPTIDPADVVAVGSSGIGPCVLPVDAALTPLRPAILYGVDTRATQEVSSLTSRLGTEAIVERCGNELSSQSAGPKIAWLRTNEPQVHAAARFFLTSQSFIVAKLTGSVVIDHATASYFHPLYELERGQWNVSGCEDFVRLDQLPKLGWASEIAGKVSEAASRVTGLQVGTPVIIGTADAPAEAVAAGVLAAGDMMVMYGSSSFMIQMVERSGRGGVLWHAPYVFKDSWQLAGGTSTAGTMTRWVSDLLLSSATVDERGVCGRFEQLVELAERSPAGAHGLITLPYLSGERTPLHDPAARGVIAGLGLEHGPSDVARSAIEGVAHSMVQALNAFTQAGYGANRIAAVGGGIKNHIWLQAVCDISGREQGVVQSPGACFGDAALAALGVGALNDPDDIRSWIPTVTLIHPDTERRSMYERAHKRFVRLYPCSHEAVLIERRGAP